MASIPHGANKKSVAWRTTDNENCKKGLDESSIVEILLSFKQIIQHNFLLNVAAVCVVFHTKSRNHGRHNGLACLCHRLECGNLVAQIERIIFVNSKFAAIENFHAQKEITVGIAIPTVIVLKRKISPLNHKVLTG